MTIASQEMVGGVATLAPDDAAVAEGYRHCWRIATAHYENFTVGSWLLPRPMRHHVAAIYAFARTADDLADEGELAPAERLTRLGALEETLEDCFTGRARDPLFVALARTVAECELPIEPFRRLLSAFRSDVTFRPFPTFAALREYCRCSADPVGHLVLHLFGYRDAGRQELADCICTGLQLANFWQDLAVDAARGRVYLPLEDMERFGCTPAEVLAGSRSDAYRRLLTFEVDRARALLTQGLELAARVERRLAREVRLFAWGGLAILAAIEAVDYDVWTRRPTLSRGRKAGLVLRALLSRGI